MATFPFISSSVAAAFNNSQGCWFLARSDYSIFATVPKCIGDVTNPASETERTFSAVKAAAALLSSGGEPFICQTGRRHAQGILIELAELQRESRARLTLRASLSGETQVSTCTSTFRAGNAGRRVWRPKQKQGHKGQLN